SQILTIEVPVNLSIWTPMRKLEYGAPWFTVQFPRDEYPRVLVRIKEIHCRGRGRRLAVRSIRRQCSVRQVSKPVVVLLDWRKHKPGHMLHLRDGSAFAVDSVSVI